MGFFADMWDALTCRWEWPNICLSIAVKERRWLSSIALCAVVVEMGDDGMWHDWSHSALPHSFAVSPFVTGIWINELSHILFHVNHPVEFYTWIIAFTLSIGWQWLLDGVGWQLVKRAFKQSVKSTKDNLALKISTQPGPLMRLLFLPELILSRLAWCSMLVQFFKKDSLSTVTLRKQTQTVSEPTARDFPKLNSGLHTNLVIYFLVPAD